MFIPDLSLKGLRKRGFRLAGAVEMEYNKVVATNIENFILKSLPKFSEATRKEKGVVLSKLIRGCKCCGLCYDTKFSPVPPKLTEDSLVLFIGRSPNKTEAMCNEMYPDGTPVGKLFRQYLSILDVAETESSVINMVYCYTKGNRPPESRHISICSGFKKMELEVIGDKLRVVFMMGNDAVRWVFGSKFPGVRQILGKVYKAEVARLS